MNKQLKCTLQWILGIAASAAAVVILLITAFEAAMYLDFSYYQKEYEKYNVLEDLDMEMEDVMYVTEEMMAYLRGEREELRVITNVDGVRQDFFNEQDRFHMEEVQGLFLGGMRLRESAAVVLVVCVLCLILMKADLLRILSKSWQIILGVLLAAVAVLGIAVARDFNAVFTLFHEIFFDNDLWIFDPATDYMIRMLPEGLFFDFVIRIGWMFLLGAGILLLLSLAAKRRWKKEEQKRKNTEN